VVKVLPKEKKPYLTYRNLRPFLSSAGLPVFLSRDIYSDLGLV